ncbi:hypothetical protein OUZ56_004458 [Daphnia magna]|uniref:Uncharacterized protein n=1 Tax=Daphnia magna TaxID=35525 RepID=A0ABQ9YPW6_9CRUS|nr:hypothetical protein OUZ56_004458 [Daphnia magna]
MSTCGRRDRCYKQSPPLQPKTCKTSKDNKPVSPYGLERFRRILSSDGRCVSFGYSNSRIVLAAPVSSGYDDDFSKNQGPSHWM